MKSEFLLACKCKDVTTVSFVITIINVTLVIFELWDDTKTQWSTRQI